MHLAGVWAIGRKTNECPRRLTLPKPLTPAESRRQLKLLLTDMQMARSNVLESYERLLGCFCVPATTTLRRLREMARFMARSVKGGRITDHRGGGKVYHWSRRWSAIMSAPSELGLGSEVSPRTACWRSVCSASDGSSHRS